MIDKLPTYGELAFNVGVDCMRLYASSDRVAETRRVLESYRPAPVLLPINRLTKGESDAASNLPNTVR